MSRSQIRRVAAALVLVAILVPALPSRAEAAGSNISATASGIVDFWNQFWSWLLGKGGGPDLPTQAQGRRNGPPEAPPDTDKGSGIDPNGGGGGGGGGE